MDNYLIAKATDVGITRQVNEDSMTVFDSPNGQVLAVCDGMGGQAAGDVASQLAVNIIESILTDNTFPTPEEAIRSSVLAANQGVLNKTAQNPELNGMGSTCVMLIIKEGRVHCGWVGDSRIYYIANHTIRQISHDQSYVQQLVDSGQLAPEQAASHPQKNEITNCIGLEGMVPPETVAVPIVPEPGSVFLLCSDGLSGMVDERQIERVVSGAKLTLQQKADRLVELANEAGGMDNITVVMVQFGTAAVSGATSGTLFEDRQVTSGGKKKGKGLKIALATLAMVLVAAGAGVYYVQQQKDAEEQMRQKEKAAPKTVIKQRQTVAEPAGKGSAEASEVPGTPQQAPAAKQTKQPQREKSQKGTSIAKQVKENTAGNKGQNVDGTDIPNPIMGKGDNGTSERESEEEKREQEHLKELMNTEK